MSDFYRRFLAEDVRKMGAASGRQVFLAAFGKHPGWDDHVEDLGLETESLVYAKSRLYVQGIGGQIDSGAWEKLDESQRLPVFKHILLWQRGNQVILGRMWASSDGKGRTRYPLIVCAHCAGVSVEWVLEKILPRLEEIERACASTSSAADVRAILERHRAELRTTAGQSSTGTLAISSSVLAEFMNHPALGPEKEGWFRILHQLQSQMALFAPGRFSLKGDLGSLRPQQVRVPAASSSPESLLLWSRFFQTQVDPAVPLLYTLPLDGNWLDVTAGEITPAEVFALRASPKAVPLASEVPYNLEPAFREKARSQLAAFAGDTAMKARPSPAATGDGPASPPASGGGRMKLLRWLGGGAAVIAAGALAVALTFGNRGKEKQVTAATPASTPVTSLSQPPKDERPASAQPNEVTAEQKISQARQEEERRLAQAADAERRRQADAAARLKADEEARQRMIAAEAEKRRLADQETRMRAEAEAKTKAEAAAAATRAELEAREKIEAEAKARAEAQAKVEAPKVVASVVPASAPETKAAAAATPIPRQMTNSVGLALVLLPGDLWAGKFEVTQGEYVKVMGTNPSKVTGNPRLPVESLTWDDASKFCEKLTELEKAAGSLPSGFSYSLPTLAQWDLLLGDASFDQAVTSRLGVRNASALVGTLPPNKHGLHDVLGNVWEWCLDGPGGLEKGLRGGAFNNLKTFRFKPLNPDTVHKLGPREKSHDVGFRCILAKSQ